MGEKCVLRLLLLLYTFCIRVTEGRRHFSERRTKRVTTEAGAIPLLAFEFVQ